MKFIALFLIIAAPFLFIGGIFDGSQPLCWSALIALVLGGLIWMRNSNGATRTK